MTFWFTDKEKYTRIVLPNSAGNIEVSSWLLENIGLGNFLCSGYSGLDLVVRLKNKDDGLLFLLRWGGNVE